MKNTCNMFIKNKLPIMCELTDQIHTITAIMPKDTYSENDLKY